jgi:hypothetical protein
LLRRRKSGLERKRAVNPSQYLGLRHEKLSPARRMSRLQLAAHDCLSDWLVSRVAESTCNLKWRHPHLVEESSALYPVLSHSCGATFTTRDTVAAHSCEGSVQKRALKDRLAASAE